MPRHQLKLTTAKAKGYGTCPKTQRLIPLTGPLYLMCLRPIYAHSIGPSEEENQKHRISGVLLDNAARCKKTKRVASISPIIGFLVCLEACFGHPP